MYKSGLCQYVASRPKLNEEKEKVVIFGKIKRNVETIEMKSIYKKKGKV